MASASTALRYVPQGSASLSSDAPGWSAVAEKDEQKGPTCWKCKGLCSLPLVKKQKRTTDDADSSKSTTTNQRTCPVCKGKGHLPIRSKYLQSQKQAGAITSRRRRPREWKDFGHVPPAMQAMLASAGNGNDLVDDKDALDENTAIESAISLLAKANGCEDDYDTKRKDVPIKIGPPNPKWLPSNPGEQLCNLVGKWRILQRVASHRWTTDDLATAYVGASTFVSSQSKNEGGGNSDTTLRYLDLGTGNASVLQMASWYLLSTLKKNGKHNKLEAVGVEARSEAVGLARRSLSFNLGAVEHKGKLYTGGLTSDTTKEDATLDHDVQIVQGDFRDLITLSAIKDDDDSSPSSSKLEDGKSMRDVASKQYDLITGTPPYFRVDFTSSKSSNNKSTTDNDDGPKNNSNEEQDEVITSAVIQQGGMPTSMQSAPARCEFRGGVEAYCLTASAMLSEPNGIFCVCENWLNNDRVWKGAKEAGLTMECVWPVKGGVRKEHNLFAVYVMKKKSGACHGGEAGADGPKEGIVRPSLVVRDKDGNWTKEYAKVLEAMSIPPL